MATAHIIATRIRTVLGVVDGSSYASMRRAHVSFDIQSFSLIGMHGVWQDVSIPRLFRRSGPFHGNGFEPFPRAPRNGNGFPRFHGRS